MPMTNTPAPRWGQATTWTGSKMFIWSGWPGGGAGFLNDGALFDPVAGAWTAISATGANAPANGSRAVMLNGKVVVWGGLVSGASNAGSIYDPVTNLWSVFPQMNPPPARSFHAMVSFNNKIFVWGGYDPAVFQRGDGAVYDSTTLTWTPVSTVGAPTARQWVEAVWTGSKILIFGGCLPYNNEFHSYDPATNTWARLSSVNAPSARCGNKAVWTGTKMIVHGGGAGGNPGPQFNDGGIYDPATNTWAPLSTVGSPVRSEHSAVWTGTEMLVWGGYEFNSTRIGLNTGAKFK